ncbi:DUF5309 family protein [Prosthecobacter sp.]|uniref:SU10 major capsid protein n=1 Tax=Prosthecobacter sp. TaxID=1965333 RepID=UPI003783E5A6
MIVHSGNQTTIKPDVYDFLRGDIDLSQTPIYNRMPKGPDSPDANLFHYEFDAPTAPDNGGSPDGQEVSSDTAASYGSRANIYGRMHHYEKPIIVGGVAQGNQVFATGGRDEYAYQAKEGMRTLMRSAEYTIVGGQESQTGSNVANHKTRGFERHLVDTAGIAAQTDTPTVVPSAFRCVSGALKTMTVTAGDYPLTEDDINDPFSAIWDAMKGTIDLDVFCTRTFKRKVSKMGYSVPTDADMTIVRRYNTESKDMKITTRVDTYQGDCGTARFQLHPWLRFDTGTQLSEAIGIDFRYGCLRMRQTPKVEKLPKSSNSTKGLCTHTFGLQYVPKMGARWKRSA